MSQTTAGRCFVRALALAGLLGVPNSVLAEVLFVNASLATGANSGATWSDAFKGRLGLQSALAAAEAGDEIWVAAGEYAPAAFNGNPHASFVIPSGVAVLGGFAGGEASASERDPAVHVTVLSGDLNSDDEPPNLGTIPHAEENSRHVVMLIDASRDTVLDGFSVRSGNAAGGMKPEDSIGADVLILGGAPIVRACVLELAYAAQGGAGLACVDASPLVENCLIRECRGDITGGGMASFNSSHPIIHGTHIEDNIGQWGSGLYIGPLWPVAASIGAGATIEDSVFTSNLGVLGTSIGGGVYILTASVSIVRCRLEDNFGQSGGGLYIAESEVNVSRTELIGNQNGGDIGGAMFVVGSLGLSDRDPSHCTFSNCRLSGNSDAGVINGGATVQFRNCTIAHTGLRTSVLPSLHTFALGGPCTVSFANCVLWGNDSPSIEWLFNMFGPVELDVERSIVQGWNDSLPGDAVAADPLFTNPLGADGTPGTIDDDLRLSAGSPAIDAGDNSLLPVTESLDMLGFPRLVDHPLVADTGAGAPPLVDLGAHEFQFCPGDANGDGVVDFADLNAVLDTWGTSLPALTGGDITGDGLVDFADLNAILDWWQSAC